MVTKRKKRDSRLERTTGPDHIPSAAALRRYLQLATRDRKKCLDLFPRLSFAEQSALVLFTSGTFRQELIIASPHAESLVKALPESELFVTVKEIGLADAHPLLSLMTPPQLRYLADLELWSQGVFQPQRMLELTEHLHMCGEDSAARWLETADPELIVRLLQEYGSVRKFDVYQDPVECGDQPHGGITYDGYYFFHPSDEALRPFFDTILRILSVKNPALYAWILESASHDLKAEVEEEAATWRQVRLAEKGIPTFEEACEIYRYLSDEDFLSCSSRVPLPETSPESAPVLYPIRWLPKESFIRAVLREIDDGPILDRIRSELARLGNKVAVADGMDVSDPEALRAALAKVSGYLTIALSHLSGGSIPEAASWMSRTWVHFLFRLGYSKILELVQRARVIRPRVSFRWINRTLYLPETPMEETLRGLLRPRPLFFEGQGPDNFLGFREFASQSDIRIAEECLRSLEFLSDYFSVGLSLPPEAIKASCVAAGTAESLDQIKWPTVLATMWVRFAVSGTPAFTPLSVEDVSRFCRAVTAAPKAGGPAWSQAEELFLRWLLERIPEGSRCERTERILGELFRTAAGSVREELVPLDPSRPLDRRFLRSVCISAGP